MIFCVKNWQIFTFFFKISNKQGVRLLGIIEDFPVNISTMITMTLIAITDFEPSSVRCK